MSKIGRYIYGQLSADAGVSALVGTRIYPVFLPMNVVFPAICYMVAKNPKDNNMKFNSPDHDDYQVTLHIWADHAQGQEAYEANEDIEAAIHAALERVEGTAGGVTVESALWLSSQDGRDEDRTMLLREVTYKFTVKR